MSYAQKLKVPALCCLTLCCILLAASGCGPSPANNSNTSASANTGSAGNSAATANENPGDFMSKAMRAQFDAKSYRARMESSYGGQNSTRIFEYSAPDRFHLTSDMDELIIVGSASYRRVANGPWQKFPFDISSMVNAFRDPKMIDELRKSVDVKFVGSDVIDGTPALVYEYTMTNAFGTGLSSTAKTWIGAADSLPRRSEVEGEIDKQKTRTIITYYDYNADISIEPPI